MTALLRAVLTAALMTAGLTAITTSGSDASPARQDHVGAAISRFRAEADGKVRVDRARNGLVTFIGATGRTGIPAATRSVDPVASARAQLTTYAPMFGTDETALTASSSWRSSTGGSVVRFQQHVDGVPVLGGEVVVTQGHDRALTSMLAHTSSATSVAEAAAAPAAARRTALAITAKSHDVRTAGLELVGGGNWLYDGALFGRPEVGARSVYRFEVTNGSTVRELVLVDAATGRVLLHFNQVEQAIDRQVCDAHNQVNDIACAYSAPVARTETGPESPVADVNSAFDLTGATAAMYDQIGGLDLTSLIGLGGGSYPKRLASTVRYCASPANDPTCPMQNAFWSGRQMFFGEGYAGADDVVGHEMTHGVIDKFSQLFYFQQSGAINESLADIMGEILDHRYVTPNDTADSWTLGEDLPGGATRDLADPTAFGQPDRMTSPLYTADQGYLDNGGVHTNSGVGNKTAYLISQGGTFNGVDVTGIDGDDPSLTKTATLYLEVIKRLTSGSEYADLALVLQQACTDLASAGTAGFSATDCASVNDAIQATELTSAPTVEGAEQPADAPDTCPDGTRKQVLFNGDTGSGYLASPTSTQTTYPLWYVPGASNGIPVNARSGKTSWFGYDPDPGLGDPSASSLTAKSGIAIPEGLPTYMSFDQWRLFEWTPGATPTYNDGGLVTMLTTPPGGYYTEHGVADLPWINGPTDPLTLGNPASPVMGFGGDSHGWVSSRVDLSSFAGQLVKPRLVVRGDASGSLIGWYVDNLEVYTCKPPVVAPGPVTNLDVAAIQGEPGVDISWGPPTDPGSGVVAYEIQRSDGSMVTRPASDPTSLRQTGLAPGTSYTYSIRAIGVDSTYGPATDQQVDTWQPAPAVAVAPGPVTNLKVAVLRGAPAVDITWDFPADLGSGVAAYEIRRSDGNVVTSVASNPTSLRQTGLKPGTSYTFSIRALGEDDTTSSAVVRTVQAPKISLAASATRVRAGTAETFNGRIVSASTGKGVRGHVASLQYRSIGSTTWRNLPFSGGTHPSAGSDRYGRFRLSALAGKSRVYRVVVPTYSSWFGGTSRSVTVLVR